MRWTFRMTPARCSASYWCGSSLGPASPSTCAKCREDRVGLRVWVPETLHTLCDLLILVDQSTKPVVSSDILDLPRGVVGEWP
jgi:hypothetical protein